MDYLFNYLAPLVFNIIATELIAQPALQMVNEQVPKRLPPILLSLL
jgi:hypothetical protein